LLKIFCNSRFTKFAWAWTKFKPCSHFHGARLSHFHFSFCKVLSSPLYFLFLDFLKEHNSSKWLSKTSGLSLWQRFL
jgi:hypothetical protein